jgi:hypothetical protein
VGIRPVGGPEDITLLRRSIELIGTETLPELKRLLIVVDATNFSCSSDIDNSGTSGAKQQCKNLNFARVFGTRGLKKIQNRVHMAPISSSSISGRGIDN